jgi:hypothetical protein
MILFFVMVLSVGGFVVTCRVVRRLGNLIEEWIRERQGVRRYAGRTGGLATGDGALEE